MEEKDFQLLLDTYSARVKKAVKMPNYLDNLNCTDNNVSLGNKTLYLKKNNMITTIEKETTKQYKSLSEDLKNDVLKKSKLDKPDYSLQRFNVITKEIYYKNFVRTNLGIIKTTLDSYLVKEDYTKEDCLEVASFAKTIHDFIQQTPEFKRLVELNTKKEVKKPTTKKVVKKKNPILGNDLIKELGLSNLLDDVYDDDLF